MAIDWGKIPADWRNLTIGRWSPSKFRSLYLNDWIAPPNQFFCDSALAVAYALHDLQFTPLEKTPMPGPKPAHQVTPEMMERGNALLREAAEYEAIGRQVDETIAVLTRQRDEAFRQVGKKKAEAARVLVGITSYPSGW